MKMLFTPGPWAIVGRDDHGDDTALDCVMIVGEANTAGVAEVALVYTTASFDPDGYADDEGYQAKDMECAANARLIAAAPELLAACQKALNLLTGQVKYNGSATGGELLMIAHLHAAIEKAEAT